MVLWSHNLLCIAAQMLHIWNANTGELMRKLQGHTMLVRCVRFNSQYVVSGSYDNTVRVWDFNTGKQLLVLQGPQGHQNRVFRLQFDDVKIVSSSQDDSFIVWDFMSELAAQRRAIEDLDSDATAGAARPRDAAQASQRAMALDSRPAPQRALRPLARHALRLLTGPSSDLGRGPLFGSYFSS